MITGSRAAVSSAALGLLLTAGPTAQAQERGDCDGDGRLGPADARCALDMAVGSRAAASILDMDRNGTVNSTDARLILQHEPGSDPPAIGGRDPEGRRTGETEDLVDRLEPLTSRWERVRDDARAECRYRDAAAAQEKVVAAAREYLRETFPRGAPAELRPTVEAFAADLTALQHAAEAERLAVGSLERAREERADGRIETAVDRLEAASRAPDLPACWHGRVAALHSELMKEVGQLERMTEEAASAAAACEYDRALALGLRIRRASPALSWVRQELPRIRELAERKREAGELMERAREAAAGDRFDEAIGLARRALAEAPECDRAEMEAAVRRIASSREAAERKRKADERTHVPTVDRSVVLLIDTSGSMRGSKIASARDAAINTVEAFGPAVEVALVTYGGGCGGHRVVRDFGTDHDAVVEAIRRLGTGGGTPMAPALAYAQQHLEEKGRGGRGQILLLNDGQNDCGSVSDAAGALRRATMEIRLDAVGVGLEPGSQAERDLDDLVRAAGGGRRYSAASSDEVVRAFKRASALNEVKTSDPYMDAGANAALAELFDAVVAYFRSEDFAAAARDLEAGLERHPDAPSLHYNAMLAYDVDGKYLSAKRHAERFLALAPDAPDAGAVRARIRQMEVEQRRNPHAVYEPFDCSHLYRWARQESRRVDDATRRARVYEIMTQAQRGDCTAAEAAYEAYTGDGGRP